MQRPTVVPNVLGLATIVLVTNLWFGSARFVHAQNSSGKPTLPRWMPPVVKQSQAVAVPQTTSGTAAPSTIPQFSQQTNWAGQIATFQPRGDTPTAGNAFFASLGSNGRTCFTCHQPQSAWALDPPAISTIFNDTNGTDPLFAPVDGANCPDVGSAAVTIAQKQKAYSQLLTKGNIRVFLPIPSGAQFQVRILRDPLGCNTSAAFGLPTGMLSMYRRILSAMNLTRNAQLNSTGTIVPQGAIMWDQREPSLNSQFIDATLGHAQALTAPTADQVTSGVGFETGLFTAQNFNNAAGPLTALGANGGPINLAGSGQDFVPAKTVPDAFVQFNAWDPTTSTQARSSINHGQTIFNTRQFTIKGVAGFNDIGGGPTATCSSCHNNLNIGSDVVQGAKHLGIGDNSSVDKSGNQTTATFLPPSVDQPLLSFLCPVGSIPFFRNPQVINGVTVDEFRTSDPGVALITGKCADLGKFKVPRLSGLASRAPLFHGGNAANLFALVDFYNVRFSIGLSGQDRQDLVRFLASL